MVEDILVLSLLDVFTLYTDLVNGVASKIYRGLIYRLLACKSEFKKKPHNAIAEWLFLFREQDV